MFLVDFLKDERLRIFIWDVSYHHSGSEIMRIQVDRELIKLV